MAVETCANCKRTVGELEKAFVWQEHVVCEECYSNLSAPSFEQIITKKKPKQFSPQKLLQEPDVDKSNGTTTVLFVILVAVFAFFLFNPTQCSSTHTVSPEKTYNIVEYRVSGTAGKADVVINVPGGGTEMHSVDVPYKNVIFNFKSSDFLYLSAQSTDEYGGSADGTRSAPLRAEPHPHQ